MIELVHQPAPPSLTRFQSRNPNGSWDDLPPDVKDDIHDALDAIQQNLCVYCETTIDREKCHLEHLQPKSRYPHLTFTYTNLAQSCNSRKHCGQKKANREIPILPSPGCNNYFQLSATDGKVYPKDGLSEDHARDTDTTIFVLRLNSPDIAQQRRNYIQIAVSLGPDDANKFMRDQPFRHILAELAG